ncbi:MAG: glycoside hydrolase family protein, partial [Rhodospirillaceae bacterium]|nr:glycoside hydrolase family protein [Rhodospirillaceae bacterium]
DASINPATGVQEFGLWSSIKSLFGGRGNTPEPTAAVSPSPARPAAPPQIDSIPIAGRRNTERLGPPAGIERIAASGAAAPRFVPPTTALELEPTWRVDPPNPFYNQEVFDTFKALVANWEKPIDKKYPGPEGKITGGYGRVYPNDTIRNVGDPVSTKEAEHNLMEDYRTWADTAHRVITRELEPHQRAAMLSLMHNIGPAAFSNPNHKMLQALNRGDDVAMEKEFREWRKHYDPKTKAKVISPGLENRRDDEMNVYFGRPRRDHY